MSVIKKKSGTPLSPDEYRQKRKEIEDYFVELTVGLVRIEPETPSTFYLTMKKLGIKMDIPEKIKVDYDDDGNPIPGKMLEMKLDQDQLMEKMDEITMIRACGITREPKIVPPPAPGEPRDPEFLYWDELHPIDQRTLAEALKSPWISASAETFRS